jgi:glycosyltransferase involved in cell wall biosynthesis
MLGGGEHSFLDLLSHFPQEWHVLAALPEEGELASRLRERGLQTCIIPLPSLRPWFVVKTLSSLRSYYHTCKADRPNLIYANGSRAALYGGIVGRILRIPMIWHCRVADPDIYLDLILGRLATRIIANSMATAGRFGKSFQRKTSVVYNGVDIDWLKDRSWSKPTLIGDKWKVILVVARVSRWKRHDLAISAFEQVAATDPNVHLVCVGSQDPSEAEWWKYLQDVSFRSRVSDRIHWVDQVADVRPWYKAARLLLLCSENEPFGRVLVEAMACGVPVVATRSGGVPEIIRHGQDGFLVSPGNASEMASAMAKILGNGKTRIYFSTSAKERALSFSLKAHVGKMLQILDETINN